MVGNFSQCISNHVKQFKYITILFLNYSHHVIVRSYDLIHLQLKNYTLLQASPYFRQPLFYSLFLWVRSFFFLVLIPYRICLPMCSLFHKMNPPGSPMLEMARFHSLGWVIIFHCIHTFTPFEKIHSPIHRHFGFFQCPGYCKKCCSEHRAWTHMNFE